MTAKQLLKIGYDSAMTELAKTSKAAKSGDVRAIGRLPVVKARYDLLAAKYNEL